MEESQPDKWIEIDLDAITNNLLAVQSLLGKKVKLIAVIKHNAYGHGAVGIVPTLLEKGVDYFAVSFLAEALQLRQAGINCSILVFSPIIHREDLQEAIENGITLTLTSWRDWQLLQEVSASSSLPARVHLKVDTGLSRFGLRNGEVAEVCRAAKRNERIQIEGIYTHMAHASSRNPAFTEKQFRCFMELVAEGESQGIQFALKHCANSSVFLKFPYMQLDAVRIGTLLSGQHPVGEFPVHLPLQEPYKFKSRLISLRTLEKGSYLGYYRSYRLRDKAQVGVIPVGFSDGLALEVANKPAGFLDMLRMVAKIILSYFNFSRLNLQVTLRGQRFPVRGKVFMQMALVEIPYGVEAEIGDEVEVPVRKTLAASSVTRVYLRSERIAGEGMEASF